MASQIDFYSQLPISAIVNKKPIWLAMAVHGVSVRQSSEFFDFGRELVWQLQLAVIEWNMYNE